MLTNNDINPFDLLSGKVVQTVAGIFYFKEAGYNAINDYGYPMDENLHRENDLPAAIYNNGNKEWYTNGKKHRENDLPAVETWCGGKEWWVDGKRHRENNKPAILFVRHDGRLMQWFYCNDAEYYPIQC